jgi:hypothetical protein
VVTIFSKYTITFYFLLLQLSEANESIAIGPNFENREMGGNIRFLVQFLGAKSKIRADFRITLTSSGR